MGKSILRGAIGVGLGLALALGLASPGEALPMKRGVPVTVTALSDEVSYAACSTAGSATNPWSWISYSAKGSNVTLVIQAGAYDGTSWTMFDPETLKNNGPWFTGPISLRKCRESIGYWKSYNITKLKWVITASRPGYATTRTEITLPVR